MQRRGRLAGERPCLVTADAIASLTERYQPAHGGSGTAHVDSDNSSPLTGRRVNMG